MSSINAGVEITRSQSSSSVVMMKAVVAIILLSVVVVVVESRPRASPERNYVSRRAVFDIIPATDISNKELGNKISYKITTSLEGHLIFTFSENVEKLCKCMKTPERCIVDDRNLCRKTLSKRRNKQFFRNMKLRRDKKRQQHKRQLKRFLRKWIKEEMKLNKD